MRVLIVVVDDEPDIEMLFRQHFRRDLRAGRFDMEFASSAQGALDLIGMENGRRIILLLSDINMPGMSGLDLLPAVKQARPDLPVIMITAYGDPETRCRAVERGADGLLTKPLEFTVLRAEIDARLAERERPS
jgi:DNA-binding NtrC family response regulator